MSSSPLRRRAHAIPPITVLAVLAALLVAPACGGGSGGGGGVPFTAQSNLEVMDFTLPPLVSGDPVDHAIPLTGGCGGPYVMKLLEGVLPDGVDLDYENGRHHLSGFLLEDGVFDFRLQLIDTNCNPFISTVAAFHWEVGVGTLQIVDAEPSLIPVEDYEEPSKLLDVDAIFPTVYGQFMSTTFILAGGVKPYTLTIVDDPDDPEDGGLPLGAALPVGGLSITGTPIQVGPGGKPFRLTLEADDADPNTPPIWRKLQWKVTTPQLIIGTTQFVDGKCGTSYGDSVSYIGGVPPIAFELISDVPTVDDEDIVYGSPNVPTFPSATGFTLTPTGPADNALVPGGYPATNDDGPNYGPYPPEGIAMTRYGAATGTLSGLPRRRGDFSLYVHAYSDLVPNENGQHSFRTVALHVDPSEPPSFGNPAFSLDPSFTVEGYDVGPPTYSTLPEFEIGNPYNPSGLEPGSEGLQLLARGGVAADGKTDAPHEDQVTDTLTEVPGTYMWTGDWDTTVGGPPQPPPPGVAMQPGLPGYSTGLVQVVDQNALVRQGRELAEFHCYDYQLPDSLQNHTSSTYGFSVGPDVVIITHSNVSVSATYVYYSSSYRFNFNDNQMTIQKFEGFASGPLRSALTDADMPQNQTMPAAAGLSGEANQLGTLLSGYEDSDGTDDGDPYMDLLRCTIVATGWWDDVHGLNASGARPWQHGQYNLSGYVYYGQFGPSYSQHGNWQPSCSAVDLPDAPGVTHDPAAGVYNNGGRCYHFESARFFGVFIVRPDGKVYVPFAYKKDGNIECFGDGLFETYSTGEQNSALRTVQMTVSPDGRFAAMKLMKDAQRLWDHANNSRIVLMDLAGTKAFGGANYRIIDSGVSNTGTTKTATPSGTSSSQRVLHAASMALSNNHLYFLIGTTCFYSNTTSYTFLRYQSWSGHFLMRVPILSGTPDLIPEATGSNSNWNQTANRPMQTTFHHTGPWTYNNLPIYSYTSYGYWPDTRYWSTEGSNFYESAIAPTPFRVSRNGLAVAFLAGTDTTSYSSTLTYSNYAWVDYDGNGARQASAARRHATCGSQRGYTLGTGPNEYAMWVRFTGPTPGLEISDDGKQVAFTYTVNSGSFYTSYSPTSSGHPQMRFRQDMVRSVTTSATPWTSYTEHKVTENAFGGSHYWKFGALVFTANARGLCFWGGAPIYQSAYYSGSYYYYYAQSMWYDGSMFIHDLDSLGATGTNVKDMLTTSTGGPSTSSTLKTYSSASKFAPTSTSGINQRFGAINPMGGFVSKNRKFFYIMPASAITSSSGTAHELVGMNIGDEGTINGHARAVGFRFSKWPFTRGFTPSYIYYPGYGLYYSYGYQPGHGSQGTGRQVMAKDTGWVFWGVGYQYSGPYAGSSYYIYGGPINPTYGYGAYGYGGVGLYGFDADYGGDIASLNNPSYFSNSTGTQELLGLIEVSRDGKRLVFTSTAHYYYWYHQSERLTVVNNIDFSGPLHTIHSAFDPSVDTKRLESSTGRASEAIAIVPGGSNDIYYAFKAGGANETSMEMVRARFDPSSESWGKTRFTSVTGRMHVLYGAR